MEPHGREQIERRVLVELGGRLVGEDQRRSAEQGEGERRARLLAAREGLRQVRELVPDAELLEDLQVRMTGLMRSRALDEARVLGQRQVRDEVVAGTLEDVRHRVPAHVPHPALRDSDQMAPLDDHVPVRSPVEARQQPQQRRLAAPGRADDGGDRARGELGIDAHQRLNLADRGHVRLPDVGADRGGLTRQGASPRRSRYAPPSGSRAPRRERRRPPAREPRSRRGGTAPRRAARAGRWRAGRPSWRRSGRR